MGPLGSPTRKRVQPCYCLRRLVASYLKYPCSVTFVLFSIESMPIRFIGSDVTKDVRVLEAECIMLMHCYCAILLLRNESHHLINCPSIHVHT